MKITANWNYADGDTKVKFYLSPSTGITKADFLRDVINILTQEYNKSCEEILTKGETK